MHRQNSQTDVVIVGGGLAGLTAAAWLARAGRRVTLLEKAHAVGGRASTENKNGFQFNLGPHALYRQGRAAQILKELGVAFSGGLPTAAGSFALTAGKAHTLPAGFFSLLTTGLLDAAGKLAAGRLLAQLPKLDTQPLQNVSLSEWLARATPHPVVRKLLAGFLGVATYAHDPERMSAGAALAQFQMALTGNVWYLDGGWQTLVDGLRAVAEKHGAQVLSGVKATAVEGEQQVRGVRLDDGSNIAATAVIIAAGPDAACSLVTGAAKTVLNDWARAAIPVKAACLEIALRRLPQPHAKFALGLDSPLYFSVHSATAKLAPQGGALIHAAKYLGAQLAEDVKAVERELEDVLELLQPGWRAELVERRFLPQMTVAHALPTAAQGGLAGRPGPLVPGVDGLYVAGDWVGPEGMLADASVASARLAAELTTRRSSSAAAAQIR